MALKVTKQEQAQVSRWCEFKGANFLVRGSSYKPYLVATERVMGIQEKNGLSLVDIPEDSKQWYDLRGESIARYLIADWSDIEDADGNVLEYSPASAVDLVLSSDIGIELFLWVTETSKVIQREADAQKDDLVGKSSGSTSTKKPRTPRNVRQSTKRSAK